MITKHIKSPFGAGHIPASEAQQPATPPQGEVSRLLKPSKYEGTDAGQAAYSKGAYDQWLDDRIHLDELTQERDQTRADLAAADVYGKSCENRIEALQGQVADLLADMRKIATTYLADAHRIADAAIARADSTSSQQAEKD